MRAEEFIASATQKRALRGEIRAFLQSMPAEFRHVKSEKIRTSLEPILSHFSEIALFAATALEPDLDPLWDGQALRQKRVFYPKFERGEIGWAVVEKLTQLQAGPSGYRSPITPQVSHTPALILVPGIAFTSAGHRLGQGGGFYDRILCRSAPRPYAVGLCFQEQLRSSLPQAPHDIAVDRVISA